MSLQEIKEAVRHLSVEEKAELAACLHDWQDDAWDEQMKLDIGGGRLADLLTKVDKAISDGDLREMP